MRDLGGWIAGADDVDAVVLAAADFESDAGAIESAVLEALLFRLGSDPGHRTLIYTGGCWLYGATGDRVATEDSPLQPPAAWLWSVDHLQRVLGATNVRGIVIHPAMVYERDGGVFVSLRDDIASTGRVRIIGHEGVRWPLVHCRDIGTLYALALAQRAGLALPPLIRSADEAAAQLGEWARGYSIDQRMSGDKARRDLGWKPAHTDPLADVS